MMHESMHVYSYVHVYINNIKYVCKVCVYEVCISHIYILLVCNKISIYIMKYTYLMMVNRITRPSTNIHYIIRALSKSIESIL